jgi:hypothetical protein
MPRAGRAVWGAPSSPALVGCADQPERLPRTLLTPYTAGRGLRRRGGKGQQATHLHDVGEPHEQGLLDTEDFPH